MYGDISVGAGFRLKGLIGSHTGQCCVFNVYVLCKMRGKAF